MTTLVLTDELLDAQVLRTLGTAPYGGADIGECLAAARAVRGTDLDSWYSAWTATADRTRELAEKEAAADRRETARGAYLRACSYYRTAGVMLFDVPPDRRAVEADAAQRAMFTAAAALMDVPPERLAIPFEGTTLPGWFFRPEADGRPRPTLILTGGYDGNAEELYFFTGAAALARGYNVLAFDGPGQGAVLRQQGLTFRPDWEAVVTPVIDFALSRKEIDADRIALFGYSLGGYLVARAAAFEERIAALILDDGVYNFHSAFENALPTVIRSWIAQGRDDVAVPVLALLPSASTQVRWALNNGVWALGADNYADLVRRTAAYTLAGVADRITAPTLILDAQNDQFMRGQPQQVQQALINAPNSLITLTEAEGAGEHCHMGAMFRAHQTMFDWLDETLTA